MAFLFVLPSAVHIRYLFYRPELDIYKEIKKKCDKFWTWLCWCSYYLRLLNRQHNSENSSEHSTNKQTQLEPIDNLS